MEKVLREKWQKITDLLSAELLNEQLEKTANREQLVEMLDLNAEQLTFYIEEAIIENPFIEMEYPAETKVSSVSNAYMERVDEQIENNSPGNAQSLRMFLFEQIMMHRHTLIRDVMVKLVDYIDERGYLPYEYRELSQLLNEEAIVVLDAMTLFKQLEPAGVGAFDLQECLMLQTEQDRHAPNIAYLLLEEYFEDISAGNRELLVEKTAFSLAEIDECFNYFHSLRPVPAVLFEKATHALAIPDVSVRVNDGRFELRYNRQYYPRIIFNQNYFEEMQRENDTELTEYIMYHREKFNELAANLRLREQLILAIIGCLVTQQSGYIIDFNEAKVPFLLKDLAQVLALSESIVNLGVTNKYLETRAGIIPVTELINVTYHQGREGLNTMNVKQTMRTIIEATDQQLTDREVVEALAAQKIIISEKLVKEYRQKL